MVYYICNRCGYQTNFKSSLVNHLNRKNICSPTLEDVSIEYIKKHYGFEIPQNTTLLPQNTTLLPQNITNQHQCKFCNKVLSRYDSLNRHLKTCKKKKEVETLIISQNEEMIKMKKEIDKPN